jgi:hypothetical protein
MATCPLCQSRKGKRVCPAKRATICPVCCGEKRMIEIECPADCSWLGPGVENELRREAVGYVHKQEPRKASRWVNAIRRYGYLFEIIERAVAGSPIPSLQDEELLAALGAARRTFESEGKGILYDDTPEGPTLQALTREIVQSVRGFLKRIEEERAKLGAGAQLPVLRPDDIVECLAVLEDRCAYHIERKAEAGSLVEHLRRVHPKRPKGSPAEEPEPPRIVIG